MKGHQSMKPATPRAILAFFALFFLLCANAMAQGEEAEGVHFEHGDWEIACDNTLTCRMAGYYPNSIYSGVSYDGEYGSILITRAAGPDAPLEGKVGLWDDEDEEKDMPAPTLRINGQPKGKLKKEKPKNPEEGHYYALAPAQIRAILAAARKDGVVEFVRDGKSFTLSGKGISAVLLKMDETQGRIGTPGALIRKGDKPEESVFPPRPRPLIRAAKVGEAPSRNLTAPEFAALKPVLLRNMKENENCWEREVEEAENKEAFTLTPLTKGHVLISAACWLAAYNGGGVYWVTDSALKNPPKSVTYSGTWYERGVIYNRHKGRGPGDCWSGAEWVWDGQAFRLSGSWTTGMCRGFLGGAWHLPTFVADVVNADGTPRAPDRLP
jgi:hypothetical protein